jgi:hypothetical protein
MKGETTMNDDTLNTSRTKACALEGASTPVRYTASYSYLREAALDREWEQKYQKEKSRT